MAQVKEDCLKCKLEKDKSCIECNTKCTALTRYFQANMPARYWRLSINDFQGDSALIKTYEEIVSDISQTYKKGTNICFAGSHGVGKTYILTSILKRFLEKGYTGLYVNLNDIIMNIINGSSEDKAKIRNELLGVDLLCIDEFDGRHIADTESSSNLFGRVLEDIFRNRVQNLLPTILSTNSVNPIDTFSGSIKNSLNSLWNYTKIVTVLGKDFRKDGK